MAATQDRNGPVPFFKVLAFINSDALSDCTFRRFSFDNTRGRGGGGGGEIRVSVRKSKTEQAWKVSETFLAGVCWFQRVVIIRLKMLKILLQSLHLLLLIFDQVVLFLALLHNKLQFLLFFSNLSGQFLDVGLKNRLVLSEFLYLHVSKPTNDPRQTHRFAMATAPDAMIPFAKKAHASPRQW